MRILVVLICLTPLALAGQSDTTNFEGPYPRIELDTALANNIWQIGQPNKLVFNGGYNSANAIVTDTVNSYPAGNLSRFTYGFDYFYNTDTYIDIYHRYECDSGKAACIIELSEDGGLNWDTTTVEYDSWPIATGPHVLDNYQNMYSKNDTVLGGYAGFTGSSNGWVMTRLRWMCYALGMAEQGPYARYLRFSFYSDSSAASMDGWVIDDIVIMDGQSYCSGIDDSSNEYAFVMHPNPTTGVVMLDGSGNMDKVQVLDMFGRQVTSLPPFDSAQGDSSFELDLRPLPNGIYFLRIEEHTRKVVLSK